MSDRPAPPVAVPSGALGNDIQTAVVGMYSAHPSPSRRDKLEFAAKRMSLRLYCCGIGVEDYVGRRILDAGCGTGEYACWFAAHGGEVTGIDLSDGSLSEARAYAQRAGLRNVAFEKRSVLDTGLTSESFDLVYCTGVLHHMDDSFGGLRELTRVLRPGGKILISLYNAVGFIPRELRRTVARRLGGSDLERRVRWGRRLFPFTSRQLTRANLNDPASALYDYFAIPYQSRHTIGEALRWFDRLDLTYLGSFPPAVPRDYPAMLKHDSFASVDEEYRGWLVRLATMMSREGAIRRGRPGFLSRTAVQLLWLLAGIDIWSTSAQKAFGGPASART